MLTIYIDFPVNDKVSVRFYYNLGIEYYKLLQQVHGSGQLMAMIDGDSCVSTNNYDDVESNQLVPEFQHLNFESNTEIDIQSPTKVIEFISNYGFSF